MSLPYLPLFIDDYEAATAHLTMLEDGAYNRLLRLCWRSPGCKLPNDDAWIMRKMRAVTEVEQAAVRSVLDEFFTTGRGKIWSPVLLSWVDRHRKVAPRPWIPLEVQRAVRDRDGDRCRYCGCTDGPFHLDHVQPWSRGGANTVDNLTVSCAICNWLKGARTLAEMGWNLG